MFATVPVMHRMETTLTHEPSWSSVHDLALVYLAFLCSNVGAHSEAPSEMVSAVLERQLDRVEMPSVRRAVRQAMLAYASATARSMLDVAVASLRQELSAAQRIEVLHDLTGLAGADGDVQPGEALFLEQLAERWDVQHSFS